jgi:hypothetical protein
MRLREGMRRDPIADLRMRRPEPILQSRSEGDAAAPGLFVCGARVRRSADLITSSSHPLAYGDFPVHRPSSIVDRRVPLAHTLPNLVARTPAQIHTNPDAIVSAHPLSDRSRCVLIRGI